MSNSISQCLSATNRTAPSSASSSLHASGQKDSLSAARHTQPSPRKRRNLERPMVLSVDRPHTSEPSDRTAQERNGLHQKLLRRLRTEPGKRNSAFLRWNSSTSSGADVIELRASLASASADSSAA